MIVISKGAHGITRFLVKIGKGRYLMFTDKANAIAALDALSKGYEFVEVENTDPEFGPFSYEADKTFELMLKEVAVHSFRRTPLLIRDKLQTLRSFEWEKKSSGNPT